jgi:hypothetical protein
MKRGREHSKEVDEVAAIDKILEQVAYDGTLSLKKSDIPKEWNADAEKALEAQKKEIDQKLYALKIARWRDICALYVAGEPLPLAEHSWGAEAFKDMSRVEQFAAFFSTNGLPKIEYDDSAEFFIDGARIWRLLNIENSKDVWDIDRMWEHFGIIRPDPEMRDKVLLHFIKNNAKSYSYDC